VAAGENGRSKTYPQWQAISCEQHPTTAESRSGMPEKLKAKPGRW